jgi:hypothetical protein
MGVALAKSFSEFRFREFEQDAPDGGRFELEASADPNERADRRTMAEKPLPGGLL